jgi:hypothetical protein
MKRAVLTAAVSALLVATLGFAIQAVPNFAGKWTRIDDPAAPPPTGRGGGALGGLGAEATIVQDAKMLTITRTTQAGELKTMYNLDGTESKNTFAARAGGAGIETLSKAKMESGKLVISTTINIGGNPIQTSMSMMLNATGQLVVESTSPGRQGGAPTTTKSTYRKGT